MRRPTVRVAALALVLGAAPACALAGHQTRPSSTAGFGWFRAAPPPAGWSAQSMPLRAGRLAVPPGLTVMPGDHGTVSAGRELAGQIAVYLNATPQQGGETLTNWSSFRVEHLMAEDARSAHLDASATDLRFTGGQGSCVMDDYVTRVGAHHYREIACLVHGAAGGSVIVVAALTSAWADYQDVLRRVVDGYQL
ncbi:MAG TPA: hypothetical protein VNG13_09455 [Mycobacteriales bacterium]|nr:hypothetical protein [Mycobacteriales bacterium]